MIVQCNRPHPWTEQVSWNRKTLTVHCKFQTLNCVVFMPILRTQNINVRKSNPNTSGKKTTKAALQQIQRKIFQSKHIYSR